MARVSRILEYRRALWFSAESNIENHLRAAWMKLPESMDRKVRKSDGSSVMGLSCRDYGNLGFAIHCAKYIDGQGVGVVSMAPATLVDLTNRKPNNSENFLNSDFMAIVKGDHIITLSAGQNAAALRVYLQEIFRKAGLPENTDKFDIVRIADTGQLERIKAVGAKSIEFNIAISEATVGAIEEGYVPKTAWSKFKGSTYSLIDGLIGLDDEAALIGESKKGTVKISINIPKNDLEAAHFGANGIANAFVEEDDAEGFLITLQNGETIRPGEMSVKKSVRVERASNTVSRDEVWNEMESYMDELAHSGYLEV